MKRTGCVVSMLAVAAAAGCVVPGTAEEFTWTVQAPASVDRGADLVFQVFATNAAGTRVDGVKYYYLVQWPGGSANPLRHSGRTGMDEKQRARLQAGTATIVVTCESQSGSQVRVGEAKCEVK